MMIDSRRIEDLFRNLDSYLSNLKVLSQYKKDELVDDGIKMGAAKYYLQVAIESCIDVANHLIANYGWRRPESMADSFEVLAENKILQPDFLDTMQRMARFRNRLVHLYWEVDGETIFRILQENLGDFERFQFEILKYFE